MKEQDGTLNPERGKRKLWMVASNRVLRKGDEREYRGAESVMEKITSLHSGGGTQEGPGGANPHPNQNESNETARFLFCTGATGGPSRGGGEH